MEGYLFIYIIPKQQEIVFKYITSHHCQASSKTQNPTYDPCLSLETQKGLQSNLASEYPAICSGLKAVSLLE